jgi:hypothetical protein
VQAGSDFVVTMAAAECAVCVAYAILDTFQLFLVCYLSSLDEQAFRDWILKQRIAMMEPFGCLDAGGENDQTTDASRLLNLISGFKT